ncbi:MAG TPA: hypothetical protein VMS29_08315, partial [Pyrinomonadaceae bacterium]|nr:hypothetical protein [Pyrinomonadaceae bacterium]
TSESALPVVTLAAGLPEGDTAGDDAGLAEAAGLAGAGGFVSGGVFVQAIAKAAIASRGNITSLLILLFFMMLVRAT